MGLEVGGSGRGRGDERSASRSERAPRTMPPGRRAAAAAAAAAVPPEAGREKAATSEATILMKFDDCDATVREISTDGTTGC